MELNLTRETLRYERLAARGEEQVTIEGEATLPGSMRDAVTVLSVQAQAYISDVQAGMGEAGVRGRACFQVLYTQGDLTRIRTLETNCTFEHTMTLEGVEPGMRLSASADVIGAEGKAASGRMTLRARLSVSAEAFESAEQDLVADVTAADMPDGLQKRMQTTSYSLGGVLGTGKALVREEFDLPERLGVGDVLSASAAAGTPEISGGSGRIGVSGVVEVRVLHRARENGEPLVTTLHELPYTITVETQAPEDAQMTAQIHVIDVMADSAPDDKGRTLRVEAEVQACLRMHKCGEIQLLEDVYSTTGPVLEPVYEQLQIHAGEKRTQTRESVRLQAQIPADAPPIGRVLAAFAHPVLAGLSPSGRRLNTEGVMNITLIYLPSDSDVPCSVQTREMFTAAFPAEASENAAAQAYMIETNVGPSTSDRAELRCVLGLRTVEHDARPVRVITEIAAREESERARGFVLVWPEAGESRWDTARRLRVPESSLRPMGARALLAFRR